MRVAIPSAVTAATSPVQSTWPWTMWPPSASPAFSAGSRFTREPCSSEPRLVKPSDWFMTSAENAPSRRLVTVRHTPLTATESPSFRSPAKLAAISKCAPSSERWTDEIAPSSLTMPVNTLSPPLHPGDDQQVGAHRLVADLESSLGIGDAGLAGTPCEGTGAGAAQEDRRDEQAQLIDLACVHERAGEPCPALDEERGDLSPDRKSV